MQVLDKQKGTKVTLQAGEYQLKLGEAPDIHLDQDRVQITRNGVAVVTISKLKDRVVTRPKEVPATPPRGPLVSQPRVPPHTPQPVEPANPPPGPVVTQPVVPVNYLTNSIGMKLAPIASGKFLMGTSAADVERFKKEQFTGYVPRMGEGRNSAARGPDHQGAFTWASTRSPRASTRG